MKKYRFVVDVPESRGGVVCGYVYAASLAEAKRVYQDGINVIEREDLDAIETGDDVTWIDEE